MNERGVALIIAIVALLVISALVASTFFIGRLEQRTGAGTVYMAQASEAADAGLAAALDEEQSVFADIPSFWPANGSEVTLKMDTLAAGVPLRYEVKLRRLNASLFLVHSTGERLTADGAVLGTSERGLLVRTIKGSATALPLGLRSWMQLY